MVRFIEVDPDEFPNLREGTRGRVAYPIMKLFLESDKVLVRLDPDSLNGRTPASLATVLSMYAKSHGLPVKIIRRKTDLYLMRLDLNADGTPKPDWDKAVVEPADPVIPVDDL